MAAFNTYPVHVAENAFAFEAGGKVFEVPVFAVDDDADPFDDEGFFNEDDED